MHHHHHPMSAAVSEREQWVTGLEGGSSFEVVALLALVLPLGVAMWRALQSWRRELRPWPPLLLLWDLAIGVGPALCSVTLWSEHIPHLVVGMGGIVVVALWVQPTTGSRAVEAWIARRPPALTDFRGLLMLMTMISILAVDFPVYPRRFAKTETYGVSLMDCGVGAFVLSAGTIAGFGRNRDRSGSKERVSWFSRVVSSVRSSAALLGLGLIRLVVTTAIGYQHHVSEYGLHWNFFFTLAALGIVLPSVPRVVTQGWRSFVCAGAAMAAHHCFLVVWGGEAWMITGSRDGFVAANREGLVGLVGFVALYWVGHGCGHLMADWRTRRHWAWGSAALACVGVVMWALAMVWAWGVQGVSRRLVSPAYVVLCVALYAMVLGFVCLVHVCIPVTGVQCNGVIQVVNAGGLVSFLVANVSTGIVNVTMNTLTASTPVAMCVLSAYVACVVLVSWLWAAMRSKVPQKKDA